MFRFIHRLIDWSIDWLIVFSLLYFRLDPALIRPGRVDLKEYVGHVTHRQLVKLFLRFYPTELRAKAEAFAEAALAEGFPISAAQVQGLFLMFKHNPGQLAQNLHFLGPTSPLHSQSIHQAPFHEADVRSGAASTSTWTLAYFTKGCEMILLFGTSLCAFLPVLTVVFVTIK